MKHAKQKREIARSSRFLKSQRLACPTGADGVSVSWIEVRLLPQDHLGGVALGIGASTVMFGAAADPRSALMFSVERTTLEF